MKEIYRKFSLWGGTAIGVKPEKMLPLLDEIPQTIAHRLDLYVEVLRKLHPWEMGGICGDL